MVELEAQRYNLKLQLTSATGRAQEFEQRLGEALDAVRAVSQSILEMANRHVGIVKGFSGFESTAQELISTTSELARHCVSSKQLGRLRA